MLVFQWWIWVFALFILGANGIMVCKDIPDVESDRHAGMMISLRLMELR
jgi:4-hydroxybenzoate polyprenyltransferase